MQTPAIQTSESVQANLAVQAAPVRPRFVPLKDGPKYTPYTEPALRDLKFKAYDRKNSRGETIKGNGTGTAGVWVQIGSKVLLDLDALDRWFESHKTKGAL
jgi:hypothetical protein